MTINEKRMSVSQYLISSFPVFTVLLFITVRFLPNNSPKGTENINKTFMTRLYIYVQIDFIFFLPKLSGFIAQGYSAIQINKDIYYLYSPEKQKNKKLHRGTKLSVSEYSTECTNAVVKAHLFGIMY
jgi:hypothetical protein